jgi:hypothetical protein
MLEHAPDEAAFARELARITKPGGRLIVNTPHLKHTLLKRVRHAIGQTDEKHGHLRPGYTRQRLHELLSPAFELESDRTYSRFFSEAVDTGPQLGRRAARQGVFRQGHGRHGRRPLAPPQGVPQLQPGVSARVGVSRLDALVPASGYMLIASARRL